MPGQISKVCFKNIRVKILPDRVGGRLVVPGDTVLPPADRQRGQFSARQGLTAT